MREGGSYIQGFWPLSLHSVRTPETFNWNTSGLGFVTMSVVRPLWIIMNSSIRHVSVGQIWQTVAEDMIDSGRGSDMDPLGSCLFLIVRKPSDVTNTSKRHLLAHTEQERHEKPTLKGKLNTEPLLSCCPYFHAICIGNYQESGLLQSVQEGNSFLMKPTCQFLERYIYMYIFFIWNLASLSFMT